MARPAAALLAIIAPASGHFVWLSANGHGEAVAEFNEPGRLTDLSAEVSRSRLARGG